MALCADPKSASLTWIQFSSRSKLFPISNMRVTSLASIAGPVIGTCSDKVPEAVKTNLQKNGQEASFVFFFLVVSLLIFTAPSLNFESVQIAPIPEKQ